jgi:peptidoglycan/xylan/chitin deacetylase (PgdA/CDA1 family)
MLEDTLGAPVRYFRPPYGSRRPDVLRSARELALEPVLWTAAGHDWRRHMTPEKIITHLRRGIEPTRRRGRGSTLLLHDGGPRGIGAVRSATTTAVPMLLRRLKNEGYRFVTPDVWTKLQGEEDLPGMQRLARRVLHAVGCVGAVHCLTPLIQ